MEFLIIIAFGIAIVMYFKSKSTPTTPSNYDDDWYKDMNEQL